MDNHNLYSNGNNEDNKQDDISILDTNINCIKKDLSYIISSFVSKKK